MADPAETINSSLVVLIALVVLTALIFGMDTAFAKFSCSCSSAR